MLESQLQRISLKQLFTDDPVTRVIGLLLSLLAVLLLGILGFKLGVKISFFIIAILLGYLFFKGALFLSFVAFLGLVSGIIFFKFPLIGELLVSVGVGEIIVFIIAIFFMILYLNRLKANSDPFKIPLLIILFSSIISLTHSRDILVSIFVIGWMFVGYLFYRWMIHFNAKNVSRTFDFVIFIASFFVILCVLHYSFSPYKVELMAKYKSIFAGRYTFVLAGPNSMSGVLATLIPIFLLYIKTKRFPYRIFWIIMGFLSIFVLYFTASRNGYLASAVSIIATVALIVRKKYRIPAVLSTCVIILFLSLVVFPGIMIRITTILNFELDRSSLSRLILWQQAWVAMKKNCLTGVGIGNFFYLPMSLNLSIAHNQLLNMLAETGIIGGAGYIVLLYFIFRILIRSYVKAMKRNNIKVIFTGSLIASWLGFAFHNFFDGIWAAPHHTKEAMFFWLLLALTVISTRETKKKTVSQA
jgi:O-antigen ligase